MEHLCSRLLVPDGNLLQAYIFSNILICLKHIEENIINDGSFQSHGLGNVSLKDQQHKLKNKYFLRIF